LISRIGEDMQEVAEDWLVFVMTGSPFLLGFVAFCKGPSRVLLAPIFGALADRMDRKKIMISVYQRGHHRRGSLYLEPCVALASDVDPALLAFLGPAV
jgi:MFS family permease